MWHVSCDNESWQGSRWLVMTCYDVVKTGVRWQVVCRGLLPYILIFQSLNISLELQPSDWYPRCYKWNETNGVLGHLCAHIGKLGQENLQKMVRWMRWDWPPDTAFKIQALAVWGRIRYYSVTGIPTILGLYEWAGKKHLFHRYKTCSVF